VIGDPFRSLTRAAKHFDKQIDCRDGRVTAQDLSDATAAASKLENALRAPALRDRIPERQPAARGCR